MISIISEKREEKSICFFRREYRNRRKCNLSSNLYVLSFKRTEDREDDRRFGYGWIINSNKKWGQPTRNYKRI